MNPAFYQACYGRAATGWSILNASENLPKNMVEDFMTIQRSDASGAGEALPNGGYGGQSCMTEVYSRDNVLGYVHVQYQVSDNSGRPISFSQGYLFPDSYNMLKEPNRILCISKSNFSDQQIPLGEKTTLRSCAGALNNALITLSQDITEELTCGTSLSLQESLTCSGMDRDKYLTWMIAVYSQLFLSKTQKSLYVVADGTEENVLSLLYLTYIALPYSLRPLVSASTYHYEGQRNTSLIFCTKCPHDVPWINPATGENNIINPVIRKRIEKRNPIISASIEYVCSQKDSVLFDRIEQCLSMAESPKLAHIPAVNLAYSIFKGEFKKKERLPAIIYQWFALPVPNSNGWEQIAVELLDLALGFQIQLSEDTKNLLTSRSYNAITESFPDEVEQFLSAVECENTP